MPLESVERPAPQVALEERLSWLERHVTAQDKEMLALHDALARLRRDVAMLRAAPAGRDEPPTTSPAPEPRPPHY